MFGTILKVVVVTAVLGFLFWLDSSPPLLPIDEQGAIADSIILGRVAEIQTVAQPEPDLRTPFADLVEVTLDVHQAWKGSLDAKRVTFFTHVRGLQVGGYWLFYLVKKDGRLLCESLTDVVPPSAGTEFEEHWQIINRKWKTSGRKK